MGFNSRGTELLLLSKKLGIDFEVTATIGRQGLHLSADVLQQSLNKYNYSQIKAQDILNEEKGYAESFLRMLGAKHIDSVDASSYESATIIQDMNLPIGSEYKNKYSAVIDGGSLEHVFNFPVAIKNCMEMIKTGGYYIGITPSNNFFGHGFYQFSPELYFRIFSKENGFKVEKILFYADRKNAPYFEVSDPNDVQSRVILSNRYPSNLFVIAKKVAEVGIFSTTPQQSDYQHLLWQGKGNVNQIEKNQRKISLVTKVNNYISQLTSLFKTTGDANEDFFKKLE